MNTQMILNKSKKKYCINDWWEVAGTSDLVWLVKALHDIKLSTLVDEIEADKFLNKLLVLLYY